MEGGAKVKELSSQRRKDAKKRKRTGGNRESEESVLLSSVSSITSCSCSWRLGVLARGKRGIKREANTGSQKLAARLSRE